MHSPLRWRSECLPTEWTGVCCISRFGHVFRTSVKYSWMLVKLLLRFERPFAKVAWQRHRISTSAADPQSRWIFSRGRWRYWPRSRLLASPTRIATGFAMMGRGTAGSPTSRLLWCSGSTFPFRLRFEPMNKVWKIHRISEWVAGWNLAFGVRYELVNSDRESRRTHYWFRYSYDREELKKRPLHTRRYNGDLKPNWDSLRCQFPPFFRLWGSSGLQWSISLRIFDILEVSSWRSNWTVSQCKRNTMLWALAAGLAKLERHLLRGVAFQAISEYSDFFVSPSWDGHHS